MDGVSMALSSKVLELLMIWRIISTLVLEIIVPFLMGMLLTAHLRNRIKNKKLSSSVFHDIESTTHRVLYQTASFVYINDSNQLCRRLSLRRSQKTVPEGLLETSTIEGKMIALPN
jgi:ACR3 family arsenite efflux pump ArsB